MKIESWCVSSLEKVTLHKGIMRTTQGVGDVITGKIGNKFPPELSKYARDLSNEIIDFLLYETNLTLYENREDYTKPKTGSDD